jgi:hypothetical protein
MKRLRIVHGLKFVVLFFLSTISFASSFNPDSVCPTKVSAKVIAVEEIEAPFSSLPKNRINFEVLEVIQSQDDIGKNLTLEVVRNGPVNFVSGEVYTISLRNGYLCHFE